jgi:hypothetical protein
MAHGAAEQNCRCQKTVRRSRLLPVQVAPGSVSRFALNVPINSFPPVYAAEPKLNIEFGPGIGPSASTSVLT